MYRFLKAFLLLSSTLPAVYCMDRGEVIQTMNTLLSNEGWEAMDVFVKEPATNTAVSSKALHREPGAPDTPVTEHNVDAKLRLMSVVLSCKYAEIVWWYVEAICLILTEGHGETAEMYLRETLRKIKKLRPLLMNMFGALSLVNRMDVAVTVSAFEHGLWALITYMDAFHENHEFVLGPLQQQTGTGFFDLLSNLYDSFNAAFQTYSSTVIEFVDGFCVVQSVPNRENFDRLYTQSPRQMGMCDFLCTVLDTSVQENQKYFFNDLGFIAHSS